MDKEKFVKVWIGDYVNELTESEAEAYHAIFIALVTDYERELLKRVVKAMCARCLTKEMMVCQGASLCSRVKTMEGLFDA